MTLIAAFIEDGCPIVLGDLLISAPGSSSLTNLPMWQRPDLNISVEQDLRLAGLAQKVVIVSDRLCVAWAGSKLLASSLLKYLHEAEQKNPGGSLVELFSSYPAADYGDLEMVAYAYEPGCWRTFTSPAMLTMEYSHFKTLSVGGNGTSAFLKVLDTNPFVGSQEYTTSACANWLLYAQAIMGLLMSQQNIQGYGLEEGWGGGFEIAYYDHSRAKFMKMSNALYLKWHLREVAPLEYSFTLQEPFVFQWSVGEQTAFWSDNPGISHVLYIVSPPWLQSAPFPFSMPFPETTFLPDYIFNFLMREDIGDTSGVGCSVKLCRPEQRDAAIKVGIPGSKWGKTHIVIGNSLAIELAERFVPPGAKVVEYDFMGAGTCPWPPEGKRHFAD